MANPKKRILLIIGGGIAAYKCLELIRRARERGYAVRAVMTAAAAEFVTPLSVGALTGDRVFLDLFSLDDEREIGHIRLSREADLIIIAPATADLMAKMAGGHADDLATAVLMATDKPVLIAPAMNPFMWRHPATQRNAEMLRADGIRFIGPNAGEMAERNEAGPGRMAEPHEILAVIEAQLGGVRQGAAGPLSGRHVLITSGPTHEPIDPVRYIANRSSGKQGHAIAAAAAALGARVTLVSGPTIMPDPAGVDVIHIESARDMLAAVESALPADCAIFAAAVADWRVAGPSNEKIKKGASGTPHFELVENPDILSTIAHEPVGRRPALVVGFAAETENVIVHARKKLKSKGCDWIVANDVSPETGIMGGDRNAVHLVTAGGVEDWPEMDKAAVARELMNRAAQFLQATTAST
ncbi:MAG: bifunctional phosphopantothenoylcysteine decarboxylase/phosphopantothenate--cysteine ligase CoaBC [Hyphomicrobiaceae bacterium]